MRKSIFAGFAVIAAVAACNEIAGIKSPSTLCGNGIVDDGEECDDGNLYSGDDCSIDCEIVSSTGSTGGTGGTGTTGGSTGGTGATGGTGGMAAPPSCANYCMNILANCTGDKAQYSDDKACQGICARLEVGKSGEPYGETLGCREHHAGNLAKMDAKTHCPQAGPLGDGVCSTDDCSSFCKLAVAVCGDQAMKPYADEMECKTACAMFPDTKAVPYSPLETSGNSLACRMYHLSVASGDAASAMVHCSYVSANSAACK